MMYDKSSQQLLFRKSMDFLKQDASELQHHIEELREILRFHEWKYYVMNDPVISDFEYDQLYKKLEAIEEARPELVTPDSPTQRVSDDMTEDFPTVRHLQPMLSLGNSYDLEDLREFDRQIRKLTGVEANQEIEYAIEPKFDGGSIAIVYEGNRLVRAATRGNGVEGDDITANIRTLRSVPLKADFSKFDIAHAEVRGEAIIPKALFAQINKEREETGESLFANPRNTATGGLRVKNPEETKKRGIEVFIYTLGYARDEYGNDQQKVLQTHDKGLRILEQLGFKIPHQERAVCRGIDEVFEFVNKWEMQRESYPYEIDGMVVKVNDLDLQEKCGYTSHHPRWAIAYKFKAKQATTQLLDVEYQVGKVGSITPVAKMRPVQLAGVAISSISLHNEDFIKAKDLHIGDFVVIERAGDVIPYVVKALPDLREPDAQPIDFPKYCPLNAEEQILLVREESEAAWRCPTCTCGAQPLMRMVWHVSREAMDIDGLGRAILERFYEQGWVRNLADLYDLDYEKISTLEGFGKRSAENLRKAIEKAKKNPIRRLLHSLSIHHLGKRASAIIAAHVSHVLDLTEKTEEELIALKDIGPVLAKNIIVWFSDPDNLAMLHRMESLGVNLTQTADDKPAQSSEQTDGPLSGKTILFTGTLQTMTRDEAKKLAEAAGGRTISAVSSKLDILVAGEKAGSKLRKAQDLGTVTIMNEEEFVQLLKFS
jgi:DNA ligase (NAD+)